MKLLHRMLLKMLPGPFLACMGTLMFLLLMQFLMRYLPDLVGKGLPLTVIFELIIYNLAYMVVLAVPMSILIATTMACGQLAEAEAYTVIKNAGISFPRLVWPVWGVGLLLMGGMLYFNNIVLPEANYRAKNLWIDVRQKKPGFELDEGMFYTGLQGYSLRAETIDDQNNTLRNIVIFENPDGLRETTITARRGSLNSRHGGQLIELTLRDGELHRLQPEGSMERYEHLTFTRHKIQFDISDLSFDRSSARSTARSDRTMPTRDMIHLVDSLGTLRTNHTTKLRASIAEYIRIPLRDSTRADSSDVATDSSLGSGAPNTPFALADLSSNQRYRVFQGALQDVRSFRSDLDGLSNTIQWYGQQINRYRVEIHKKMSIATACIIFVLIGAPLGLMIQRGSISVAGGLSAGIFLFYWVTLVQGEKLADRGFLEPWIGMWGANTVVGLTGLFLCIAMARDYAPRETFQRILDTLRNMRL
jgi:lipopolysaccharide export system permease protein